MEKPVEIQSDPGKAASESSIAKTTDVALLVPSPNWFFSRILTVTVDGWILYGATTRGICILSPRDHGRNIYGAVTTFNSHTDRVSCIATPDDWVTSRRFITGGKDGFVKQWRVCENDGNITVLPINAHEVHRTVFQEREELIGVSYCGNDTAISMGKGGIIAKWNLTSNVTRVYKNKLFKNFRVTCMECCPHNPLIVAVGTKQGVVFLVDISDKVNVLSKVRGHNDEITDISWCPQAEVTVDKVSYIEKSSVSQRMERIQQGNDPKSELEQKFEQSEAVKKDSTNTADDEDNIDETNENDTVVEEDDLFDIYTDHEHDEFGHKKYQPEVVLVKVEKPKENVDFLAECLNLKKDIMQNKNKQEESIHSLVQSLENAAIGKSNDQNEPEKECDEAADSPDQATDDTEKKQAKCTPTETVTHLFITCDKHGKTCLWAQGGRQVASFSMTTTGPKLFRSNLSYGSLHWYRPDVLLMSDGKTTVLESNPLRRNGSNQLEWKALHSIHKRNLYCITSAAPKIQTPNCELPDFPIFSIGQERKIVLFSHKTGREITTINSMGGHVYHIAPCLYDSKKISITAGDGVVRVAELGEDVTRPCQSVAMHWQNVQGKVIISAWHPIKENLLAFGTAEGRVGVIKTGDNDGERPANILKTMNRGVYALTWGEGYTLYVSTQGDLFIFDVKKKSEPEQLNLEFEGKVWRPTEVHWTQRGMVVGSRDGDLAVLMPHKPHSVIAAAFPFQKQVQCAEWHPQAVTLSEETSPYKNWIAACTNETYFKIFSLSEDDGSFKLSEVATVTGHKKSLIRLVWSPHRNGQIVSTSKDSTVRVWNITASGEVSCVSVFDRHLMMSLSALWWPDPAYADYVLSGAGDQTLRLWNITEFPPDRATSTNKLSTKPLNFPMASSENDATEKDNEKEKSSEQDSRKSREAEKPDYHHPEVETNNLANNFEYNRNLKLDKKVLFPIIYKQMMDNALLGCKRIVRKYTDMRSGEAQEGSQENGENYKGTDFVKLFGTVDEFNEVLDMEQGDHLQFNRTTQWVVVSLMRGQVDKVFQLATARNILSPFLLSIAPMVSHKFWKDQVQAYILQMDRKAAEESVKQTNRNEEKRESEQANQNEEKRSTNENTNRNDEKSLFNDVKQYSTVGIHRKMIMMLTQHNVMGAINMLVDYRRFHEAYILARVRHMDDVAKTLLEKWMSHYLLGGNKLLTAFCYLVMDRFVDASTILSKLPDEGALELAAEVAKLTGQDTLAHNLLEKQAREQKTEEILKDLPDRLALHLKIKQLEQNAQSNGTEKEECEAVEHLTDLP